MKSHEVQVCFTDLQGKLYSKLNNFSRSNEILGRLCSIPVSILDVALDTLKTPLSAIEYLAMAAINLIGALFSKKYTLKDALANTEWTFAAIANTPVKLFMAPIKIVFQFFAILIHPEKVEPIDYNKSTFKY